VLFSLFRWLGNPYEKEVAVPQFVPQPVPLQQTGAVYPVGSAYVPPVERVQNSLQPEGSFEYVPPVYSESVPQTQSAAVNSTATEYIRIRGLLDSGLITPEEFEKLKADLLSK
jgi:hypothetical protein